MTNILPAVELAIYIALVIPTTYLIFQHRREGLIGWLFLSIFCIIRIIGSALGLQTPSPISSIISSVGLSPLLLATSGILHEARIFRTPTLDKKLEWAFSLLFHIAVVGGVALTAAGSNELQSHEQPTEKAEGITKAGMAILALCWATLLGTTGLSFMATVKNSAVGCAGIKLLIAIGVALIFIGIRVFYSVVYLCTQKAHLNPATGSLAVRVVLGFLSELIAALILVVAGFMTQGAAKQAEEKFDMLPIPQNPRLSASPERVEESNAFLNRNGIS